MFLFFSNRFGCLGWSSANTGALPSRHRLGFLLSEVTRWQRHTTSDGNATKPSWHR